MTKIVFILLSLKHLVQNNIKNILCVLYEIMYFRKWSNFFGRPNKNRSVGKNMYDVTSHVI